MTLCLFCGAQLEQPAPPRLCLECQARHSQVILLNTDSTILDDYVEALEAMNVRELPEADPRVETGTVQFGEDWPGLFLRGKHAFWFAQHLEWAISLIEEDSIGTEMMMRLSVLKGLLKHLQATRVVKRAE